MRRGWAIAGTLLFSFEEPRLERRFGAAWLDYRSRVRRWLPRWPPAR